MSRNVVSTLRKGAPVFAALGDETRLRIVAKLSATGPLSIAQLTEGEQVTRQAITKHLGVLAAAGIVRDVRRGRERLWDLELAPLETARFCLDTVSLRWDQRLARLAELVESD
jgi:DNA-binding transcriptional ArsR family regulator